jgi:hypothetical protein
MNDTCTAAVLAWCVFFLVGAIPFLVMDSALTRWMARRFSDNTIGLIVCAWAAVYVLACGPAFGLTARCFGPLECP